MTNAQSRAVKSALLSGIVVLLFAVAEPQATHNTCDSPVPKAVSPVLHDQTNHEYRRPPMVAFDIQQDGTVTNVRVVRKSGSKALDEKLRVAALRWLYEPRPGCRVFKVALAAGAITDAETAVKVGEPELIRTYGATLLAHEQPITAEKWKAMWVVGGTLHCFGSAGRPITNACVGGVAVAHIAVADGRVVDVYHEQ